jgi:hypothetical protein|tara:strand:+ start:2366 stop:2761 length:396 start_codon:yes stop_codon:yes gene_type:complete
MTEENYKKYIEKYKSYAKGLNIKLNRIYNLISFTTVGEVLDYDYDYREVYDEINKLSDSHWVQYKIIDSILEEMPYDDFDEWGATHFEESDKISKKIVNKLDFLSELSDSLNNLHELKEDDYFKDIKTFDL